MSLGSKSKEVWGGGPGGGKDRALRRNRAHKERITRAPRTRTSLQVSQGIFFNGTLLPVLQEARQAGIRGESPF